MSNLALCNYALPGGRIYRQPRLRDQTHCRFHICNHTVAEHEARMDRLFDQLAAMDLPELLEALRSKLEDILCILRCDSEARLALHVAIERLNDCRSLGPIEPMIEPQPHQNQSSPPEAKNLTELLESPMHAMTCDWQPPGKPSRINDLPFPSI